MGAGCWVPDLTAKPYQLMPDVEPENESRVVLKKLLSLAMRFRERKNFGPTPPPRLPNLPEPSFP